MTPAWASSAAIRSAACLPYGGCPARADDGDSRFVIGGKLAADVEN